ncbi:MAG: peptidoglycan-binding protein [Deltaproteobacteria bacterium]|nr:peptidoglycan-binding protein [Deltaproteobacteria bacterium]
MVVVAETPRLASFAADPASRYAAGPSLEEVANGRALSRGQSGEGVRELQRLLNQAGAQPPLVEDGLFGPKTEAALRSSSGGAQLDAATLLRLRGSNGAIDPNDRLEAGHRERTPIAPQLGAPAPSGSIPAGALREADEVRRRGQGSGMKSGAPPGYAPITGRVPPGVVTQAKGLLHHDYGTEIPFELDGQRYLARLERHYHPPGFQGGPNGWHKGVTVYRAT